MIVNGDFDQRCAVHGGQAAWLPSPLAGVDRIMLDRIGAEVARATSLVRYAPESSFSPHVHAGGEEFLVLEGVFQDEHGDFPVGSYVRNPPQTAHTPGSDKGCVIFVKLWQFDPADRTPVCIDTTAASADDSARSKRADRLLLHEDTRESVQMVWLDAGTPLELEAPGGMEVLVVAGGFEEAGEEFSKWSWLRLPCGYKGLLRAGNGGAVLWTKRGHLHPPIAGPQP